MKNCTTYQYGEGCKIKEKHDKTDDLTEKNQKLKTRHITTLKIITQKKTDVDNQKLETMKLTPDVIVPEEKSQVLKRNHDKNQGSNRKTKQKSLIHFFLLKSMKYTKFANMIQTGNIN